MHFLLRPNQKVFKSISIAFIHTSSPSSTSATRLHRLFHTNTLCDHHRKVYSRSLTTFAPRSSSYNFNSQFNMLHETEGPNKQQALTTPKRIAFIGGGNMAEAIIGGLLSTGYPADHLIVAEPMQARKDHLTSKFTIRIATSNDKAIMGDQDSDDVQVQKKADIIVFAVKPQVMKPVAMDLAAAIQKTKPIIITIAAGIRISDLAKWLSCTNSEDSTKEGFIPKYSEEAQNTISIVRAMPNTPALLLCGATGLYAADHVTPKEKSIAYDVLSSVSQKACWVEREDLLDVVTALSGSGPAYFFYFMESLISASKALGLPEDVARSLAAQTCIGAGKMVLNSDEDCASLRKKVTSPGGTTEAAIKVFGRLNVDASIESAVDAAFKRSGELGDLFGKETTNKL